MDFILGDGEVAIEVKGTSRVDRRDLTGLETFRARFGPKATIVVCNERRERRHGPLHIMPSRDFLDRLWAGGIMEG